ncbi:hypothetical protein F7725_014115 [Dissostichus mawsoni]|uniref:Uncharacterized protein n=1 Tax=Dissostichus mawsoni TaxID=36200 RepID=A0A7J5YY56_DISMA|nr:hypothetical protein F7725_014115 [Dissostichus mawsoni]
MSSLLSELPPVAMRRTLLSGTSCFSFRLLRTTVPSDSSGPVSRICELVGVGQQTVPGSAGFIVQTALGPVKLWSQRAVPQCLSIRPVHCHHKHTWRGQTWNTEKTGEDEGEGEHYGEAEEQGEEEESGSPMALLLMVLFLSLLRPLRSSEGRLQWHCLSSPF